MVDRYKVIFDDPRAVDAAVAMDNISIEPRVINHKRNYISFSAASRDQKEILGAEAVETDLHILQREFNAKIVKDFQYDLENKSPDFLIESPEIEAESSLNDVVSMVKADRVWEHTRGKGVIIAVVDTGIAGDRAEFPAWKRSGSWQAQGAQPWTDWNGHGTMCGVISAGTTNEGGAFDGIAPDASLMACRTHFYDSELTAIYDALIDRANNGEIIVATNSFGLKVGSPPSENPDNDFPNALDDAINAGVHLFFSAGNNHQRAGGTEKACDPNSIWLYKSRSDVTSVATCDLDGRMWYYSSRGPGQYFGQPHTNKKPDIIAPTPRNGQVVYGSEIKVLENGWGTSGACPQVAGLAALLLSLDRSLDAETIRDIIRSTADPTEHAWECSGAGMINCESAVKKILVT